MDSRQKAQMSYRTIEFGSGRNGSFTRTAAALGIVMLGSLGRLDWPAGSRCLERLLLYYREKTKTGIDSKELQLNGGAGPRVLADFPGMGGDFWPACCVRQCHGKMAGGPIARVVIKTGAWASRKDHRDAAKTRVEKVSRVSEGPQAGRILGYGKRWVVIRYRRKTSPKPFS